jgi:2-polyprenyl-6-methoxyphenol hydroxylase-like FAD-dependent oxidoreductase
LNTLAASAAALWNHTGRHLATVPFRARLPDGTTSLTLKRARLSRVLEDEALRRGVRIEFDKRLASAVETDNGRVIARFSDGKEAEGDLLIGADGIHSVTRQFIDPAAPHPRYVGLTNFGGSDLRRPGMLWQQNSAGVHVCPGAERRGRLSTDMHNDATTVHRGLYSIRD